LQPIVAGHKLLNGCTQLNRTSAWFTFHANQMAVVNSFNNVGQTFDELNRADAGYKFLQYCWPNICRTEPRKGQLLCLSNGAACLVLTISGLTKNT
jgi:hypothetical protein